MIPIIDDAEKALLGCSVITRYNNKSYKIDGIEFSESPKTEFTLASGAKTSFYGVVHQIVSPITNSEYTNFFNQYLFKKKFNWQTKKKTGCGPIRRLFSFSTAQTEKNLWEKNREINW